jgi:hypothetical protein
MVIDWVEILKILSVLLTGATKFMFAPALSYELGYGFWKSMLFTTSGGIIGIFSFAFLGHLIRRYWRRFILLFWLPFTKKTYSELIQTPRKKFKNTTRWVIRIKNKFGIVGIAALTPLFLSIPVGTVVAMSLFRNRFRSIFLIICFLIFWSVLLNIITPPILEFIKDRSRFH